MYRRDIADLSDDEVDRVARAIDGLYNLRTPTGVQHNALAWFVKSHDENSSVHGTPYFLPWHRRFVRQFEKKIQEIDPGISLPYWDSSRPDARDLGQGKLGIFVGDHTRYSWRIRRDVGKDARLPTLTDVVEALTDKTDFSEFRRLEHTSNHGGVHRWIGGDMADPAESPTDPLFFLLHANIDRLWAIWQRNNPRPEADQGYPASGAKFMRDHKSMGYRYERDFRLEKAWYERNRTILITGDRMLEMGLNRLKLQDVPQASAAANSDIVVGLDFVYGNKRTKELHTLQCHFARLIRKRNLVPFETIQEALAQGYNGCGHCLPEHQASSTHETGSSW